MRARAARGAGGRQVRKWMTAVQGRESRVVVLLAGAREDPDKRKTQGKARYAVLRKCENPFKKKSRTKRFVGSFFFLSFLSFSECILCIPFSGVKDTGGKEDGGEKVTESRQRR